MKAVYFNSTGGPEVLVYGDLSTPVPGPGELGIDVHAASVNGVDWRIRTGQYKEIESYPYVLGRDFSGTVAAVGPEVSNFAVGDVVFGVCETADDGAYAERLVVNARNAVSKPDNLSHEAAAALALAGLTAVVSLEETLQLRRNERILILGGAGGVGSFAIQLARHVGAEIATTASQDNHSYLKKLGAHQVIDYRHQDFRQVLAGYDAVLDTVGGAEAEKAFDVLRRGGRGAFIASGPTAPPAPRDDLQSLRPQVKREQRFLQRIIDLYEQGAIQLPEIRTFPLHDALLAHQLSESRHLRGKLVLQVRL